MLSCLKVCVWRILFFYSGKSLCTFLTHKKREKKNLLGAGSFARNEVVLSGGGGGGWLGGNTLLVTEH